MLKFTYSFCKVKYSKILLNKLKGISDNRVAFVAENTSFQVFVAPFVTDLSHLQLGKSVKMSDDVTNPNKPSTSNSFSPAPSDSDDNEPSGSSQSICEFAERKWENVEVKNDVKERGRTIRFQVLSYNVLAQYLLECHAYLYKNCDPQNLQWSVRSEKIYQEIVSLNPDIICLQEVQVSHMESFYKRFEQIGYCGIFKKKTGPRYDGCAIFYKEALFILIHHTNVEFFQPLMPVLNRDNIGIIAKLAAKCCPNSTFVVATTHLLYNPNREDVREAQMHLFLAEIDRVAYLCNNERFSHLPIILTGDFNSFPYSGVIKLLENGVIKSRIPVEKRDWTKIGITDNCQHLSVYLNQMKGLYTNFNKVKLHNTEYTSHGTITDGGKPTEEGHRYNHMFNSGLVSHKLNLRSVYEKKNNEGEKFVTTFQDYWVMVDYIYYSTCGRLKVIQYLSLPTRREAKHISCLPNDKYGSDHLSTAALFELTIT